MNESPTSSTRLQLAPIVLGALIGFIPSFVTTAYQLHVQTQAQRKQILFDRRITALKDLAAAVNTNGDLFIESNHFEKELNIIRNKPDSDEALRGMVALGRNLLASYERYNAAVRTQLMITRIVFGREDISLPPIVDYPDFDPLDTKGKSKAEVRELLRKEEQELLSETHALNKNTIAQIDNYVALISVLQKDLDAD
jgi:hypothetical protein